MKRILVISFTVFAIVAVAFWFQIRRHSILTSNFEVRQAWSQVVTQHQRRVDLMQLLVRLKTQRMQKGGAPAQPVQAEKPGKKKKGKPEPVVPPPPPSAETPEQKYSGLITQALIALQRLDSHDQARVDDFKNAQARLHTAYQEIINDDPSGRSREEQQAFDLLVSVQKELNIAQQKYTLSRASFKNHIEYPPDSWVNSLSLHLLNWPELN